MGGCSLFAYAYVTSDTSTAITAIVFLIIVFLLSPLFYFCSNPRYLEPWKDSTPSSPSASMPYSDYGFALAVPSQRSEDFVYALSRLMEALGGVPAVLVPDNLKAAVVKSDRHEPEINGLLADFACHYGCMVQPARVRHPKDKSAVENTVKLVYQRVYAPLRNTVFHSLEELNTAIAAMMTLVNEMSAQPSVTKADLEAFEARIMALVAGQTKKEEE